MRAVILLGVLAVVASCTPREQKLSPGTYGYDVDFVGKHQKTIELKRGDSRVLLVANWQGRVLTSTSGGNQGNSYGWINYKLIESGQPLPHMNPFGGEDRFWLGPEGGQYALFFKRGDPFDFDHWQTPAAIDTEPFEVQSSDSTHAVFGRKAEFVNYSGTRFSMEIQRTITLLSNEEIVSALGVDAGQWKAVAFRSDNVVTNTGNDPWTRETGMPSIWILGMFNPSPATHIFIPYKDTTNVSSFITADYFGTVPVERLQINKSHLVFSGDGKYRSKLGIAPAIARNIAGSYDGDKHILTIVQFSLDPTGAYVNSKWENQAEPYKGDAVNSYNDGPLADGSQLGPFYEIESSSPALGLSPGQQASHSSLTVHFEGTEEVLDKIALRVLGVSLKDVAR